MQVFKVIDNDCYQCNCNVSEQMMLLDICDLRDQNSIETPHLSQSLFGDERNETETYVNI